MYLNTSILIILEKFACTVHIARNSYIAGMIERYSSASFFGLVFFMDLLYIYRAQISRLKGF